MKRQGRMQMKWKRRDPYANHMQMFQVKSTVGDI